MAYGRSAGHARRSGFRDSSVKSVTGKEFARALEKAGWRLLRINGSHHIFGKEGERVRISVPIHANEALKPGLLSYFLKQSGLQESDL